MKQSVKKTIRNIAAATAVALGIAALSPGEGSKWDWIRGPIKYDTLKVTTYNILNYPGNDTTIRNPYFRDVMGSLNPDVLVVQEMVSPSGMIGFRNNVLNSFQPNTWNSAPFNDGPDTDNALFYKDSKVQFISAKYFKTALRDIAEYTIWVKNTYDTLRIYSVHLKAGNTSSDISKRKAECDTLRNYLNKFAPNSKFMIVGDYNIYRSTEPAFERLIGSETNNNGRSFDPLNAVGTWNNNATFKSIHTQSPRTRSFGGGATGGMDDRFDMFLLSNILLTKIVPGSYIAYGNDGNHFNDSINKQPNTAVPVNVANALHYASDHLPVYAKFIFKRGLFVSVIPPDSNSVIMSSSKTTGKKEDGGLEMLLQNYPNPFNGATRIGYSLPYDSDISLKIYDVLGEEIMRFENIAGQKGEHYIDIDLANQKSGVYIYRLESNTLGKKNIITKKMMLVK